MKHDLIKALLGTDQFIPFLANLIWAYVGALVMVLLITTKRDPASAASPIHFSWSFFWSDNAKKIMATVILILAAVRFSNELFPTALAGSKLSTLLYFVIGLGCDRLSQFFKDKNYLGIGDKK